MHKTKNFLIRNCLFIIVLALLVVPILSFAADTPLVPCGTSAHPAPCGFNDLMTLVNTVIHFILFDMVVPIAAIMCAYAGFLMVTAGGDSAGARKKAKDIFFKAIVGLIIAIAAWLIISTILAILGYDGTWIGLKISL
jgi:hypothetical protein